jgi:hypothetical protein
MSKQSISKKSWGEHLEPKLITNPRRENEKHRSL